MGTTGPAPYLQITPALTSPTLVLSRKSKTAPVYLPSVKSSLTDMLLGLALACLTWNPKPLLLSKGLLLPSSLSLFPDMFPTAVHSSLISFSHALHSLNRCSLLYLPSSHHQHLSDLVHPHLSFKKGAIIACPLSNWKNLAATLFLAALNTGRMPGRAPWPGTGKAVVTVIHACRRNIPASGD